MAPTPIRPPRTGSCRSIRISNLTRTTLISFPFIPTRRTNEDEDWDDATPLGRSIEAVDDPTALNVIQDYSTIPPSRHDHFVTHISMNMRHLLISTVDNVPTVKHEADSSSCSSSATAVSATTASESVSGSRPRQIIHLKLGRWGPQSRMLKPDPSDKWIVYQTHLSKHEYLLTILDRFSTLNWMSRIPDSTSLASMYLPGTHESLAFYGGPISTCQSPSVSFLASLEGGCRFVDLRFKLTRDGVLLGYHGIQNEYVTAIQAFEWLYDFVRRNRSEAIVVSIKQENAAPNFEAILLGLIDEHRHLWFTEDRWPDLGQVRGKLVLFCRFGFAQQKGLHPLRWPNNSPVPFLTPLAQPDCLNAEDEPTALIQDWYSIGSFLKIPEKAQLALSMLHLPTSTTPPTTRTMSSSLSIKTDDDDALGRQGFPSGWQRARTRISFLSGATLLTAFPSIVAKGFGIPGLLGFPGVNERVLDVLLRSGPEPEWIVQGRRQGLVLMLDFWEYPQGFVEVLIGWNWAV